jgi:Ca2+-binding RTX toxin-like protein
MNPFVQQLEDRRLLSATLTDGVLTVEGTKSNDNITLSLSSDGSTITVSQAKARRHGRNAATPTTTTFTASDVKSISVNGGKGNDNIVFKSLGDTDFTTPATILGGDGNDWISAGAGSDIVYGEAGNDRNFGGEGADHIYVGRGSNLIRGEGGRDIISANLLLDDLRGNQGDSILAL